MIPTDAERGDAQEQPQRPAAESPSTRRDLTKGVIMALAGAAAIGQASSAQSVPTTGVPLQVAFAQSELAIIDTLAELVALPVGPARRVALVLGYAAINDGGGGMFLWDPNGVGAPNGGTLFASSLSATGRWLRLAL